MATGRVRIKTVCLCAGAVIALEAGARVSMGRQLVDPFAVLGATRLFQACLIGVIVFWGEGGLAPIGLWRQGLVPGIRRGVIWSAGFGLLVLMTGLLLYVIGVNPMSLLDAPIPQPYERIILFFLVGGVIAPITEEMFFRGVLYGFFRRWGTVAAVLFSTMAFVLAHPFYPAIPITQIVGGLLFAIVYEVEQNLMVPITIHSVGNIAIFGLSLIGQRIGS